jgi:hypothetical protein
VVWVTKTSGFETTRNLNLNNQHIYPAHFLRP